jgi:hypothetical protein
MSEKDTESALEFYPSDVNINDKGAVEIVNASLAELVKSALQVEKEGGAARLRRAVDDDNTGCGNNVYQCGKALVKSDRIVKVRLT